MENKISCSQETKKTLSPDVSHGFPGRCAVSAWITESDSAILPEDLSDWKDRNRSARAVINDARGNLGDRCSLCGTPSTLP